MRKPDFTFPCEEFLEDLDSNESPWILVQDTIFDTRRWTVVFEYVVKNTITGKHYIFYYEKAATEYQEDQDYDLELYEAESITKTVTVWSIKEEDKESDV